MAFQLHVFHSFIAAFVQVRATSKKCWERSKVIPASQASGLKRASIFRLPALSGALVPANLSAQYNVWTPGPWQDAHAMSSALKAAAGRESLHSQ